MRIRIRIRIRNTEIEFSFLDTLFAFIFNYFSEMLNFYHNFFVYLVFFSILPCNLPSFLVEPPSCRSGIESRWSDIACLTVSIFCFFLFTPRVLNRAEIRIQIRTSDRIQIRNRIKRIWNTAEETSWHHSFSLIYKTSRLKKNSPWRRTLCRQISAGRQRSD